MKTYLFYKISTTGHNVSFDQIVQFTAIRTDMVFREVEEYNMYIKLRLDVFPQPTNFLNLGISIDSLIHGVHEYEAVKYIHSLMNEPDTISVCYDDNKLNDLFLRFSFYRNLLTPYTHHYKNRCLSIDLFTVFQFYSLLKRPLTEECNKLWLELDKFYTNDAHINEPKDHAFRWLRILINIAIGLCSEKELWYSALSYFNIRKDTLITSKALNDTNLITNKNVGIVFQTDIENKTAFVSAMYWLGQSEVYPSQQIFLRLDTMDLSLIDQSQILTSGLIQQKRYSEPFFFIEPKYLEQNLLGNIDLSLVNKNMAWLNNNTDLKHKAISFSYSRIDSIDIDSKLYTTDISLLNRRSALLDEFHLAVASSKVNFLNSFRIIAIKKMAIRLLSRNYLENMPSVYKIAFETYLQELKKDSLPLRIVDYSGSRKYSYSEMKEQVSSILRSTDFTEAQKRDLAKLIQYYEQS